ncbi:MAG: hypothetical protein COB15_12115 [Flavobacteriales bacterium]|nr:MAG: hypothetical protein COB15_12115 [Flavobacteriales bacterium]
MKLSILSILFLATYLTSFGQCDSIKVNYQVDHLKRESEKKEIFFTKISKDSLQINFNDGFDKTPVIVRVNQVQKALNNSTDESLGFTGSLKFKRPKTNAKISFTYNGSTTDIAYNVKYNVIHIWSYNCDLTVIHTNRMIIYE